MEITPGPTPLMVHLDAPGSRREVSYLIVHLRAANVMSVELSPQGPVTEPDRFE